MDLQDQLKNLFPDHEPEDEPDNDKNEPSYWLQDDPIICKYEKRKGKPVTVLEGYNGADSDFKKLTKDLKTLLGVGGSFHPLQKNLKMLFVLPPMAILT